MRHHKRNTDTDTLKNREKHLYIMETMNRQHRRQLNRLQFNICQDCMIDFKDIGFTYSPVSVRSVCTNYWGKTEEMSVRDFFSRVTSHPFFIAFDERVERLVGYYLDIRPYHHPDFHSFPNIVRSSDPMGSKIIESHLQEGRMEDIFVDNTDASKTNRNDLSTPKRSKLMHPSEDFTLLQEAPPSNVSYR